MSQLEISPFSPGGKQRQSPCSLSQAGSLAHFITLHMGSGRSSKEVHQGCSSALGQNFKQARETATNPGRIYLRHLFTVLSASCVSSKPWMW